MRIWRPESSKKLEKSIACYWSCTFPCINVPIINLMFSLKTENYGNQIPENRFLLVTSLENSKEEPPPPPLFSSFRL
jgi:hypothetical protein